MGWQDDPIAVPSAPAPQPWEQDAVVFPAQKKVASGVLEAAQAGYQGSATGLAVRGKLPDIQLDPTHSTWYERLAAGATQLASEFPMMVAGGIGGTAAGAAAGGAAGSVVPVVGNAAGAATGAVLGGGAGAFALPAAIRESYIQAYSKGEITGSADFLSRAAIVLKHTGKEALVGAATAGAGKLAGMGAQAAGLGAKTTGAAVLGAEGGTLVVAPAALEGRLPEPQDFTDAAILLVGLKGVGVASRKLADIYAKTGKTPVEVMADAKADPTIIEDLGGKPAATADGVASYWFTGKNGKDYRIEYDNRAEDHRITAYDKAGNKVGELEPAPLNGAVITKEGGAQAAWMSVDEAHQRNGVNTAMNEVAVREVPGYTKESNTFTPDGKAWFDASANRTVELRTKPAEANAAIPRAYRELVREENARNAVPEPSAEAVKFMDRPFADVPQLPGEPVLPTHVNYNYLNAAEDVKGAMSRLSELYTAKINEATRGTVPWEQTYAEARAMFESATGEKAPELALGNNDYAKLSADLYARKQLLMSGAEQLMAQQKAYTEARDSGLATDQMKLELLAQIDRVAQAQAAVRGSQAEVGRALNILKSTNRDKAYYDELTKIIDGRFGVEGKVVGDANFNTMVNMMGQLGSPKEALKFAEKAAKATTWEKVVEAWKAGLVSGPITQVANILGNTTFMATRPLVDAVAVAVGGIRRSPEAMSAVEPLARITGNIHGVIDGAKVALAVLKSGELPGKTETHRIAIEGALGEAIRTPFRLLGAADAFFRVTNERGEAYALATREAVKEGYNPATREFRDRVAELATNPTDKMAEKIADAGMRFTFNSPLGEKGRSIQNTIRTLHLEWAVPFVQTPANVAKEMMRLTPAAPIIKEWREAIAKGGPEADKAVAEMVMGTAVGTAVFSFALSGNISGQGDPDPRKRATQMASGWQPYSLKVGDTWYSYQRLQPVGTLIGMAADAAAVWDHMGEDESDKIPKILSTAFANAITNQTFLQGITNIVNAISDPQRFGPKFVQNMIGSFVPSVVGQTASMMDPYQREVYSVLDAVQARIPGVRESLLPKRDPYGEPIAAKDRMGAITPITTSETSTDKVRLEAARLGVGVAKAPDSIELPAGRDKKLGKIELTPEQRDVFADKAGRTAHQILTQLVNSPSWGAMPDMAQRATMERVFEVSRKMGKAAAVPPEQIVEKAREISAEIQQRMQPGSLSQ